MAGTHATGVPAPWRTHQTADKAAGGLDAHRLHINFGEPAVQLRLRAMVSYAAALSAKVDAAPAVTCVPSAAQCRPAGGCRTNRPRTSRANRWALGQSGRNGSAPPATVRARGHQKTSVADTGEHHLQRIFYR